MTTYVLIHGASHDGSAFDRVVERLAELGHDAFAPTVAGHGKNVDKNVTHAQAVASITDYIEQRDLTGVVLLGHSFAGTIIAKVTEAIPHRIRRLIFWSAMVLKTGESMMDVWPPQSRGLLADIAAASPNNTVMLPFDFFREAFMNDADLDTAQWVYEQLSPQPYEMMNESIDLDVFHRLSTPRSWLMGTEDTAMPMGEWGWHPRMSQRLGNYRLVTMPGGHELMYTNPIGLTDKIIQAGQD